MRRPFRWLIATVGVSLVFAVLPAGALATSLPAIEWTSAWSLTPTDATVGAGIGIEDLEHGAYYQFQVVTNTSEYLSEIACPPRAKLKGTDGCGPGPEVEGALPIGFIPSNAVGPARTESVSLDLAGAGVTLKPGTTYHYRVLVARRVQTEDTLEWEPPVVVGADQTFTTPAAQVPTVEAESASHVTATGATLDGTIDPEDADKGAAYQFQLVASPGEYITEFACPSAWEHTYLCLLGDLDADAEGLPLDETAPGVEGQTVVLRLARAGVKLKPDTTYHYRVIAARSKLTEDGFGFEGPIVYGPDQTFTTFAANAPVVESVKVAHLTKTDATLEATIDSEGLETEYAFHMISSPCSKKGAGCELIVLVKLPSGGKLFGSFVPQTVSLDLNSAGVELGEGEYVFGVTASSEGGETTVSGGVFEAPEAVVEPLGSIIAPTPTAPLPGAPNDGSRSSGSSSTTPGTPSALGSSSKTGAGTGGKPKAKHGKHHKRKHHGKKAPEHPARSKTHKR